MTICLRKMNEQLILLNPVSKTASLIVKVYLQYNYSNDREDGLQTKQNILSVNYCM